jgi:hypothetical protein
MLILSFYSKDFFSSFSINSMQTQSFDLLKGNHPNKITDSTDSYSEAITSEGSKLVDIKFKMCLNKL